LACIGLFSLALVALLGAAPPGAARVAIVRPADAPPLITETLVRLQGELESVGFETEIVDGPTAGGASGAGLETLATARGVDAVVALVGDDRRGTPAGSPVADAVEVCVVDKVTGRSLVRRASVERTPSTLAIRAIELLRSSFLEIDLLTREARAQATAPIPPAAVRPVERDGPAQRPERFGVEVGAAAMASLDGVGPAVLPTFSVGWTPRPWLLAHVAAAGLGTRPTVQTLAGSAQVAQAYGMLGAGYRFRAGRRLEPFLALSAGALHTAVEGRANAPNQGRDVGRWSFLLDGALGTRLRVSDRFYAALAAHAQLAAPYPTIRFVDAPVATSGRPNLLVTVAVGAWL